ncbi:MAG: Hypothetical protein BHV28_09600 [Candidatus Tokpelaia hoelldobleri]|uniref:DUF805 domain-containing protein n=1 Tax=Candidatus Tokpelaia hoelldobleri TaxID=1902579 RepID=A0A1U9JUX8_9HYPH|nr:MAG: Hypothetical protein BHV28_09600 [Candidatus Tokpelaia hoelldoblerii]
MGFQKAVSTCLKKKYATFSGRASRSEYWWFFLFNALIFAVFYIIMLLAGAMFITSGQHEPSTGLMIFSGIFMLLAFIFFVGLIIPNISVTVRRLHDRNLSGWWLPVYLLAGFLINWAMYFAIAHELSSLILLLYFLFLAIYIMFIVILAMRGTKGQNRFGADPLKRKR